MVQVTSEEKEYPVESALVSGEIRSWRADESGTQPFRLVFDQPQRLTRIALVFEESETEHREHAFSDMFVAYLLTRNIRYEEDLVDQLFNSMARILLLLAHFGKEGKPETLIPKMSQETLAEMIGTTRSRVSFFMNRFRKLGFIDYDGGSGFQVHSSLLKSFSTTSCPLQT